MREKLQQLFICDPNRFTDVINNHDQKYSENEEENIETYALAPDLPPRSTCSPPVLWSITPIQ